MTLPVLGQNSPSKGLEFARKLLHKIRHYLRPNRRYFSRLFDKLLTVFKKSPLNYL